MQSKEPIVASMSHDNTRMTGKDDNYTHVVGKVWENTHMAGDNFDKGLIQEKDVTTHVFLYRLHILCVIVIKHLMSQKRIKLQMNLKVRMVCKCDLQKVSLRKNSCEFWKGMRKKYSHTLKDNFILNKANNQSFEIVAKGSCHISRGR